MNEIDLNKVTLRELNSKLQNSIENENWLVTNPKGTHALAVGLDNFINVKIDGSTGYYCAGMNKNCLLYTSPSPRD